jgi:type IVB pilus formation R64 PilN family outer membrane protein
MRCFILFLIGVNLTGCSGFQPTAQQREIERKAQAIGHTQSFRTVEEVAGPYLGATPVKRDGKLLSSRFGVPVTLRMSGTLPGLLQRLSTITGVSMAIAADAQKNAASRMRLNWHGTLEGVLDALASHYSLAWRYSPESGSVLFSRFEVRTFVLLTPPGEVSFDSTITNKSNTGSSSTGSTGAQVVRSSDSDIQTAQTSKTTYKHDLWDTCEATIKGFLTKDGKVVANRHAGTITVADIPQVVQQVAGYIDMLNEKNLRQVALTVKVWSLKLSEDSEIGLDVKKLITKNLSLVSGGTAFSSLDGAGSMAASILESPVKGSEAVARAMQRFGQTTLLTSGSGITMHNQPLPVQVVERRSYLASVSQTSSNDSQTTSSLQPGEVSTGFSMTVIPRIIDRRRVILQYNVTLSALEDMKDFSSGDSRIQLPQVSNRSFSQRVMMRQGQTLVLAGFEQDLNINSKGAGLSSVGKSRQADRTVIVITIDLESAGV